MIKNSKFKIQNSKFNKGFTLIELLIVIAVLSVLALVATDLFTSVIKGTNKAQVISEVKQNGQLVMEILERNIRLGSDAAFDINTLTLTTDTADIIIEWQPPTPTTNGVIILNGANITNDDPVKGVDVTAASFEVSQPDPQAPKIVRVDLTFNQGVKAPQRADFKADVRLTSTVSLRTY